VTQCRSQEKYNTAYRANLFEKVIPEKEYKYWEYVFYDDIFPENENEIYRGKIIVSKGDKKNYSFLTKDVTANYGFFIECHPAICYSYIVAVRADLTIDLVKSETDLKKFIGKVDNIEEVILIAKANGFFFNSDTIITGAYYERENDYLLYLGEVRGGNYYSIKAKLSKEGYFEVINKKFLYKLPVNIIS
jgi:hypothetical protein